MKRKITHFITLISLFLTPLSYADIVSFEYEATITQTWGSNGLVVGDTISGDFSYVLNQVGHQVNLIVPGSMTRYVNGVLTANIMGQKAHSTGGQLEVKNDVAPFGTVLQDGILINVSDRYGSIKTGSINGYKVNEMQILLTNLIGQPFNSTEPPQTLDLANYPSSKRFLMTFEDIGGGLFAEITYLAPCTLNEYMPFLGCSSLYDTIIQ